MKRDRDGGRGRQAFDHEPLGQQKRERTGQAPPAFVLEPVNGVLDRALVGNSRTEASQGAQPHPAPAVRAGGLDLCPTPPAERLLEAPDASTAPIAEPRADGETAAAPRRQQQVDETGKHAAPSLPAGVKPAFTGMPYRIRIWSPGCRPISAVDPAGSSMTLCAPHTNHTTPYHGGSLA